MFVADQAEAAQRGVEIVEPYVLCRLGCKNKEGSGQLSYSAPSTGTVTRHLRTVHAPFLDRFKRCKAGRANWNELEELIASHDNDVMEKASKARRKSDSFWKKADGSGAAVDPRAASQVVLMLWAISNGIPRVALNDPIFDVYHKLIGASPPENRHNLQDEHLPVCDELVMRDCIQRLKKTASVCLMADGWRDLVRRDWIDAGVQWTEEIYDRGLDRIKWLISVAHLDLIFVPGSATTEALNDLVANSVDEFVRLLIPRPSLHPP